MGRAEGVAARILARLISWLALGPEVWSPRIEVPSHLERALSVRVAGSGAGLARRLTLLGPCH